MLEMLVLGLTIVVAQIAAGLGLMALFMNKKVIKKFTKKYVQMCNEIVEEIVDQEE